MPTARPLVFLVDAPALPILRPGAAVSLARLFPGFLCREGWRYAALRACRARVGGSVVLRRGRPFRAPLACVAGGGGDGRDGPGLAPGDGSGSAQDAGAAAGPRPGQADGRADREGHRGPRRPRAQAGRRGQSGSAGCQQGLVPRGRDRRAQAPHDRPCRVGPGHGLWSLDLRSATSSANMRIAFQASSSSSPGRVPRAASII